MNTDNPKTMCDEYDCVVMGAGPAGGTAAALVAEYGHRTLLVEREKMPRFHVGESLMPEVYWTLKRLGVLEKVKAAGVFTVKNGVQFVTDSGRESQPFFFQEHDPRECALTWHVQRSEFDQILFENAAEKGADCFDGTRVTDIELSGPGPHRIEITDAGGMKRSVSARVIVDATGQQALIANKLGLKIMDPELRKAAIWGYFRNGRRNGDERTGPEVTCILHTKGKKAWFWYIPLSDGSISVGLVGDNDYILKGRGKPAETFYEELDNCDGVKQRLANAERIGDLRVAREFSYGTQQHAGDGWVLIGDAYSFIDPVYSSGVFLALKSGEFAADAIHAGLERNDVTAAQLGNWTEKYDAGLRLFRKLVDVFYTNEFSFGEFMKQYPEHRRNLTDLLIGRVYGEEKPGEIFDVIDPWIHNLKAGALEEYRKTLPEPKMNPM